MREELIAWLRQQPPETTFDYSNNTDCLVCRYLMATGQAAQPNVGFSTWSELNLPGELHTFSTDLAEDLIFTREATYTEALAALEARHG